MMGLGHGGVLFGGSTKDLSAVIGQIRDRSQIFSASNRMNSDDAAYDRGVLRVTCYPWRCPRPK